MWCPSSILATTARMARTATAVSDRHSGARARNDEASGQIPAFRLNPDIDGSEFAICPTVGKCRAGHVSARIGSFCEGLTVPDLRSSGRVRRGLPDGTIRSGPMGGRRYEAEHPFLYDHGRR